MSQHNELFGSYKIWLSLAWGKILWHSVRSEITTVAIIYKVDLVTITTLQGCLYWYLLNLTESATRSQVWISLTPIKKMLLSRYFTVIVIFTRISLVWHNVTCMRCSMTTRLILVVDIFEMSLLHRRFSITSVLYNFHILFENSSICEQ